MIPPSAEERVQTIISELERAADPSALSGMARAGITPDRAYGVRIPVLRGIARREKRNHDLALRLWEIDTRETRILASMIADPQQTTAALIDSWTGAFDYWEICDQCCMNLFEKTPLAVAKAREYSRAEAEFVKRTGFVLMARLAVSDKRAPDDLFLSFLVRVEEESDDDRPMVKKAVNWALRQIGKRNGTLRSAAVEVAERIAARGTKPAAWIAGDALRELRGDPVRTRLGLGR
ncbi:DNA alkylation repair protein [bacterium]|nr:DNA alkylation repair protein [bacterium]